MKHPVLLVAVLAMVCAGPVHAHGGPYRDTIRPNPLDDRDPKDPKPPPEIPPASPAPWTPDAPPPPRLAPAPDFPPAAPPPRVSTPKRRIISFENWRFWWRYNRDDILNLTDRVAPAGRRLNAHVVENQIVPALRRVIANADLPSELRGRALIALARARPRDLDPGEFLRHCDPAGTEDRRLRESGILGLAIAPCRGRVVRDRLLALMAASAEEGRATLRERAFAILALGLLRDDRPEVWTGLTARLDGRSLHLDIPACALLAIGLIGDEERVPELLEWLESGRIGRERLSGLQTAWIISALGRMGDPRATEAIAEQLRRKGRYTKRSAAIALGRLVPGLGPVEQRDYVRLLGRVLVVAGDLTTVNFATMSLGRIAASPRIFAPVRTAAIAALTRAFREENKTTRRPFAALALGLAGRADIASRRPLADLIRPGLAKLRGDRDALGALAIALGMLRDAESFDLLRRVLADRAVDVRLRRRAAVALGLLGDARAIPGVLAALREARDRDFVGDAATAAHLLGTGKAVEYLVGVISRKRNTQYHVGSAICALTAIGDRRAVEPLLAIVEAGRTEGRYPDATRALAVTALGRMADTRRHRVLFRILRDVNYRASVPSLEEILILE